MLPLSDGPWEQTWDGDPRAADLFDRHYSRNPGARGDLRICGPGEKIVLLTPCVRALFAWRKSLSKDPMASPDDINCNIFRNEGAGLSSALILAAEAYARNRWGQRRLYTYVNPDKVESRIPGYCFARAGWRRCDWLTKTRELLTFEKLPGVAS